MEIHELSLIGQLNQLKEGSLSSTELTQHYLDRISNFDEGIKLTFEWYNKNKMYFISLNKKDITQRLGRNG